ncbi:hypothetical protein KIN20_032948 [Parelaphostrongylus tenuis]|uniref:Uncharacterized protein n=1 Tax=Parelaphostrongylus tenuis TaxID=148309 RepID=A0AAD5WI15_PARTN|nr:hypothetical protein KIN20_032948 [Parelaphostrongylus tenuis]
MSGAELYGRTLLAAYEFPSDDEFLAVLPTFFNSSEQRVRFCNESQNAVCMIPPVSTTLPFAVRMAQEKQAEAKEAEFNGPSRRTDGDDVDDENVVPKCGKIIIGKCFIAVDRFVRKDNCKYHF